MSLLSEIHEQPAALERLFTEGRETVQKIARELKTRDFSYIFLAARGTSDNAGLYAKYLWGAYNRLPIALATPSLFSLYKKPPDLRGALVLGISQSGESPDIVAVLEEARRQGAPTLAITNTPGAPLAQTADYVIDLISGPELAVAATKTYSAQLLAIALFSRALKGDHTRYSGLERLPGWVEEMLALDTAIAAIAQTFRTIQGCVVLGRGYNYATAFEWSLKLKELACVLAEPYSSADFQHGPVALISERFPVLAVAPRGEVFGDLVDLLMRLVHERKAALLGISNEPKVLYLTDTAISIPAEVPEWLSPLVSIIPAQLFSYHLARSKGLNTENLRGLQKVTRTW